MISQTYYKLFSLYSNKRSILYCVSLDKSRDYSIILLKNPQLLFPLSTDRVGQSLDSPAFIDKDFVYTQSIKTSINSSSKFEKKNRSSVVSDYNTGIKRNKIANRKKKQNKINLDQEDFLIEDQNTREEEEHINLSIDLIKPIRIRKQKRKDKSKQGASDNTITENLNNTYSLIHNVQSGTAFSKQIEINAPLTVQQLANKLHVSEASIITWLFLQGISVTINEVVDISIATKVAKHYDFTILGSTSSPLVTNIVNNSTTLGTQESVKRSPIITIFGHVDHGKTSLLDFIKKTNIVSQEAGGITQSISSYEVEYHYMNSNEKLIFLDTPGHEAFTSMRLRSAEVTDIAILLVAADDGLKPQSLEAIDHIISGNIPYLVAVNKMDKPAVSIDEIRDQLKKYSIANKRKDCEETIFGISALTGLNVDLLLSGICKLSNSLNLRTNLQNSAEGIIIESYLNKRIGPIATVVLKNGTLNLGDIVVAGNIYGKVKVIMVNTGIKVHSIAASSVVHVCGFTSLPQTGSKFYVVDNEKTAKYIVTNNINIYNKSNDKSKNLLNTRVTLSNYSKYTSVQKINVIVKADTQGSLEAIINAFFHIPQDKVQINIISCSSGSVFDTDVNLAFTSQSIILGFNIGVISSIRNSAERLKVVIKNFNVIYDLLDYLEQYMLSLVSPEYDQVLIGQATVQTIFHMNKRTVAGCFVNSGIIKQGANVIVYRNNVIVYEGNLSSLKHLKDNVNEITEGNECGIMCSNYTLWQELDRIKVFEIVQKKKVL